jgi:hypothetical protein
MTSKEFREKNEGDTFYWNKSGIHIFKVLKDNEERIEQEKKEKIKSKRK